MAAVAGALPAARLESVRALSALFREAQPRETAEESVFQNVLEILTSTSSAIEQTCKDSCGLADLDTCLLLIAECFRCLRNACVECAKNQHVMRNLGLISTSVHLIKLLHGIQIKEELLVTAHLHCLDSRMEVCLPQLLHFLAFAVRTWKDHGSKLPQIVPGEVHIRYQGKFLHGKGEQALKWAAQGGSGVTILEIFTKALRCSLQFLGNIAAGNGDSQNSIWKCAFPDLFLTCLTYSDEKIVTYCCMVLFTCLNSERVRELLDPGNLTVALNVLRVYKEQLDSEWSFLIVTEHLLKCPELVKALYAKLSNQERITLLELMMVKVSDKNSVSSEEMDVFVRHADFLAVCFQEKCGAVLKLTAAADTEDEEALVTIRLLDVLCEMTSNNSQLEHLQAFPGLLETAVDTLRLTHLAGKQAVNIFTATHAVTAQEEISHPAVDFKSHLIRLIGNLCYKNKENQDKVYDMDGISLILDNCSIDDNNPFVSQWAIYAIRNLTEQNEQNQALIAQMEQKGLADSSALERMGLEIQQRDDKLILRSVRKKPS